MEIKLYVKNALSHIRYFWKFLKLQEHTISKREMEKIKSRMNVVLRLVVLKT